MAIKIIRPGDDVEIGSLRVCIYGPPGVGKTTLANTALRPLTIDAENGAMRAVNRQDYVPIAGWQDVHELMREDLSDYATLIVDTMEAFLQHIDRHILSNPSRYPGSSKGAGEQLSLNGYGVRATIAKNFFFDANKLKKDIIFIAHERAANEHAPKSPLITGSSANQILQDMTLCGLVSMVNGERYIDFRTNQNHIAKDSGGLGLFPIGSLDASAGAVTPAMQDILSATRKRLSNVGKINAQVSAFLSELSQRLKLLSMPEDFTGMALESQLWEPLFQISGKKLIVNTAISLGFVWDASQKCFIRTNAGI
jgi:hypothetical protein